jgi:hypothetical protein
MDSVVSETERDMTETTYTFCEDTVSDLHKDAYGFRPSQGFWLEWGNSTDAEKQATWDSLVECMKWRLEQDLAREREAVEDFEVLVQSTIDSGAKDRTTALRWIMDGSDCNGDWEHLCFRHGLPYGYFRDEEVRVA